MELARQDTGFDFTGVAVERDIENSPALQLLAHIDTFMLHYARPPMGPLMPLMTGHEGCITNLHNGLC